MIFLKENMFTIVKILPSSTFDADFQFEIN